MLCPGRSLSPGFLKERIMKRKLLTLFMAVILLLTGCTGGMTNDPGTNDPTEATTETTVGETFTLSLPSGFSVGWSRVNINPAEDVPLDGVGSGFDRMPNKIKDELTATLIAVSDGQSVALLCTVDNLYTHETITIICTVPSICLSIASKGFLLSSSLCV